MPNIELTPYPNPSTYRMLAANVWDHPYDPHVYGSLEVRCEKLEAWIAEKRKTSGEKVKGPTPTRIQVFLFGIHAIPPLRLWHPTQEKP